MPKSVPATPVPSTEATRRASAHQRIQGLARRTFNRQVLSEIGPAAGLFALDTARFPEPVMVSTANSAGAKLQLAAQLGLFGTVAADVVNHCVNDIAVQGGTPLFFLDHLAAAHLDPDIVQHLINGLVDACKAAGCALLGGETSELPAVFVPQTLELAGTLTGVVSRPRLLTGAAIAEGDAMLALPSAGLHCSGFSLAQHLLRTVAGYRLDQYVNELGEKVGTALMSPHRSYLAPIRKLIQAEVVTGFAHITGAGLTGCLPRVIPRGLASHLDLSAWDVPPLFNHMQQLGSLDTESMHASFNMGVGLVAFVPAPLVKKARMVLNRMNERSTVIGRVVRKSPQRQPTSTPHLLD